MRNRGDDLRGRVIMNALKEFNSLLKAFRKKEFEPLYLFWGEESFLIDHLVQQAALNAVDKDLRDFNYSLLQGDLTESFSAMQECMALPMMDERRLVVVRRFDQMPDKSLKGKKAWDAYAKRPNPEAVVMLTCAGKPNFSHLPYKTFKKRGKVVEFKPLKATQIPGFIRSQVKRRGATIEEEAISCLEDYAGTSLRSIVGEIDKLLLYIADRTNLTREDVITATGQSTDINTWELRDAVVEGRLEDAERIMTILLATSANRISAALRLVVVLAAYFTDLCQVHDLLLRNISQWKIASRIRKPAFVVNKYINHVRHFHKAGLQHALHVLAATDSELKGASRRDVQQIMTLMMYQIHQTKA